MTDRANDGTDILWRENCFIARPAGVGLPVAQAPTGGSPIFVIVAAGPSRL